MKEGTKMRGADPVEQCDSALIFAGVTALMSARAINLHDVLKYEQAAVPTSIFDASSMRKVVSSGFQSQSVSSSEDSRISFQSLKRYRRRCDY